MSFINKVFTLGRYRFIGVIALILFFRKEFQHYGLIPETGLSLILLMIIFLILAKGTWWNNIKYILVWSVIILSALGLRYGYGIQVSRLLWPMVWILGTLRKKYDRLSITLAIGTIGIIIIIAYPSVDIYNTFLALVGIFLGIRSIRIRREAYETSNLHLQELNEAHRELQQAHIELQEASVHSMRYAALEERARLAREIHDGIGHQLTSLIVQLQALEIMVKSDPEKAGELVSQLLQISKRTMAEVRLAVKEWSDDEMGLGLVALKGLISQTQARSTIKFDFYQDSEVSEWSVEISIVLYRILQESITNILRHSNAESVEVHIKETGDKIVLSVSDDGQYKGDSPLTYGFGMKGIIERCEALGGFCNITPEKPHGLKIEATLPSELELREE